MKILHVAKFSLWQYGRQYYFTDRKLSLGLAELGHFVYDFSHRDVARKESLFGAKYLGTRAMNRALLATAEALQPDLLLLGHAELVSPETLVQLRRAHPNMQVAMWYVDVFTPAKRANVIAKLPHVDAFFMTLAGEELHSLRAHSSAWLGFMPNLCHAGIETGRAFELAEHQNDFVFVGTETPERRCLLERVKSELPALRCSFRGLDLNDKLHGADYIELLSHSAMALNYSRPNNIPLYSSDRLLQLMGNGCLVFTPNIPGLDVLFNNNELVVFDGADDLCNKLAYYQANPQQRRQVAQAGHRRAHTDYSAKRGAQYMLDVLNHADLSDYAWSHCRYVTA